MSIELGSSISPESSKPLIREVDRQVPQIGRLLWIVTSGDQKQAQEILASSKPHHTSFLAWETLRKGERAGSVVGNVTHNGNRLPFTGFEGYFAGLDLTPQEIVREIASIGMRFQRAIGPDNRWIVKRNLEGERVDPEVLLFLDSVFGAEIAKLRAKDNFEQFRSETLAGLRGIPDISFTLSFSDNRQRLVVPQFEQRYVVPQTNGHHETVINLSEAELAGYRIASQVGVLGHPVVRRSLRELPPRLFRL